MTTTWTHDPCTQILSDDETDPLPPLPRLREDDRAAAIAASKVVIFETDDSPEYRWSVFIPYSWPGVGAEGWHTGAFKTYPEALTMARTALELAALKAGA